jgi:hypothetical protein
MNAKELHDLYAPLWAKHPGTRPQTQEGEQALSDAAAAICRVAVEDWLRMNTEEVKTMAAQDGGMYIHVILPNGTRSPGWFGPVHEILVTAALWVLEART